MVGSTDLKGSICLPPPCMVSLFSETAAASRIFGTYSPLMIAHIVSLHNSWNAVLVYIYAEIWPNAHLKCSGCYQEQLLRSYNKILDWYFSHALKVFFSKLPRQTYEQLLHAICTSYSGGTHSYLYISILSRCAKIHQHSSYISNDYLVYNAFFAEQR